MDLRQVSSFSQALKGINQSKSYVSYSEGQWKRVEGKIVKALNTRQIATFAQEAFESLNKTDASYSEKAALYSELASGLKDYLSRLSSHKNIFQRIGSFFWPWLSRGKIDISHLQVVKARRFRPARSRGVCSE